MALLKIAIAVIFCFHVLQLSNAKAAGPGALNKTGVLQLSNATKAAGLGSLNRTGVLLNSSTEEHLRKTRTAGYCYVDLYEHTNYGGNPLRVYGDVYNLAYIGFNDRTSSAKVYGPCQWIFYDVPGFDYRYGYPSILIAGDYPTMGQYDNQLASLRCLPPAGTRAIVFFEHRFFAGQSRVLYDAERDFNNINFDNRASSTIVTGGCWRLYVFQIYHGHSRKVCTGSSTSIYELENRVSSARWYY